MPWGESIATGLVAPSVAECLGRDAAVTSASCRSLAAETLVVLLKQVPAWLGLYSSDATCGEAAGIKKTRPEAISPLDPVARSALAQVAVDRSAPVECRWIAELGAFSDRSTRIGVPVSARVG